MGVVLFPVSTKTLQRFNPGWVLATGMASGAISMLRDFGLTLGPAIVGAIALTNAASAISAKIAASPSLQKALDTFYAAPEHVPEEKRAAVEEAVHAVQSGPLDANAVPSHIPGPDGKMIPFNPLQDVAFHALSHAYAIGFLVCGIAALLAAVIAATMLGGREHSHAFVERELADPR